MGRSGKANSFSDLKRKEQVKKKAEPEEKVQGYSMEDVADLVKAAASAAAMEATANQPTPVTQIIQVPAGNGEKVIMRWFAPVSDSNVILFGKDGYFSTITGPVGDISIEKSEWSRFFNEDVRNFIDRRWLVVMSGMTDDERVRFNCAYRPGEYMDEEVFRGVLGMKEALVPIFKELCQSHREMVAMEFYAAMERGELGDADRGYLRELNAISKDEKHPAGLFAPVISGLNAADDF